MAIASSPSSARLVPILFLGFLFFLIFVFVLVVVEVFLFFLVFVLVLFGFEFQGIQSSYAEIGAALIASERVTFIQLILVHVNHGVAVWTVDHLHTLQGPIFLYKNWRPIA